VKTSSINLKHIVFALFIATQIILAAAVSHAQPYQTINTQNSIVGDDLSRTVTTIQGSFNGPVIMFAAGHGFGSAMFSTAQLMTSASVTINFKQEYGHVDYMFGNNHLHELEHPILTWLIQKPFK